MQINLSGGGKKSFGCFSMYYLCIFHKDHSDKSELPSQDDSEVKSKQIVRQNDFSLQRCL